MREIKFRVWDKYEKRMINIIGFCIGNTDIRIWYKEKGLVVNQSSSIDNIILMQYTGLKDKNDKEIYEGDIIAPCDFKNLSGYRVLVEFKNGMYCLKPNNIFITKREPLQIHLKRAIQAKNKYIKMGNINENPELLK